MGPWLRVGIPIVAVGALFLYALAPWLPGAKSARPPRTIVLYGFSILAEAVTRRGLPSRASSRRRAKESTTSSSSGATARRLARCGPAATSPSRC
ncbi:MAG: hypothetical protein M3S32_00700 [Acidobacteriota bacterium]|nr:hypothetical protein [Acidobacteriota bacterium]